MKKIKYYQVIIAEGLLSNKILTTAVILGIVISQVSLLCVVFFFSSINSSINSNASSGQLILIANFSDLSQVDIDQTDLNLIVQQLDQISEMKFEKNMVVTIQGRDFQIEQDIELSEDDIIIYQNNTSTIEVGVQINLGNNDYVISEIREADLYEKIAVSDVVYSTELSENKAVILVDYISNTDVELLSNEIIKIIKDLSLNKIEYTYLNLSEITNLVTNFFQIGFLFFGSLIFIVSLISLFNVMLVSINEKQNSYQLLVILGAQKSDIKLLIFIEVLLLLLISYLISFVTVYVLCVILKIGFKIILLEVLISVLILFIIAYLISLMCYKAVK